MFNCVAEYHETGHGTAAADRAGDDFILRSHAAASNTTTFITTATSTIFTTPFQLILSGKIDPETNDVYSAIMASSSSVTRHHPDLSRGGNSEFVQDVDAARLRTLKFHNIESVTSSDSSASAAASAEPIVRTISHLVYVDPLSPPGRLLLLESFKASTSAVSTISTTPTTSTTACSSTTTTFIILTLLTAPQRPLHRHPPPRSSLYHLLQSRSRCARYRRLGRCSSLSLLESITRHNHPPPTPPPHAVRRDVLICKSNGSSRSRSRLVV